MKYCVCTDAVFMGKSDMISAMEQVKKCGFDAVEFWTWWDKDMEAVIAKQQELGLETAAFCAEFIEPGDEKNHSAYEESLKKAIGYAKRMNCGTLIAQAGWVMDEIPFVKHRQNIIKLFRRVAPMAEQEGITLVIEPLNKLVDHPTYHLSSSWDAFGLAGEVGSPNVKILFDIYHQQITEGNLISNITEHIDRIGHFHAAGNPGRNEITKGEICYRNVFTAIKKAGYKGYVGLEYMTQDDPCPGLVETREQILI